MKATDPPFPPPRMDPASRAFVHAAFLGAIVLQRFCVYVAGSPLFVAQVLFAAAVLAMLATRRATVRPGVALLLAGFTAVALVSALIAVNDPDPRVATSIGSLLVILALYVVLVVRPLSTFDAGQTFSIFVKYMRVCSVLGILQYALQFAGVRAFSFLVMAPILRPVLVEPLFNYQPIIGYGSTIMRSNGFFLVEPSVFSQFLVLATVVDIFVRREWRYVPLYVVAHLLSYSGTGLLALAITLPLLALVDLRSSGRVLAFAAGLLVVGGAAAVVLPDQFAALTGRADELNYAGSSGYARYIAPLGILGEVWGETRTLIGYGPGALERASFYVPGSGSALVKLFIDYGLLGLVTFATFLLAAIWRRDIAIICLYGVVNFQFGGGFLLFAPFIVILATLCIWSAPSPHPPARGNAPASLS